MSLLRTTLGRSGDLTMQLEIFVEDLICRCALSAASCDMERCFLSPDEEGSTTSRTMQEHQWEERSSGAAILWAQDCQNFWKLPERPTIHFTCSPTCPMLQKDRRKEQQKPRRKERERGSYASETEVSGHCHWWLSFSPRYLCYTEDQGVPGALQLLYYGLTWSLCRH